MDGFTDATIGLLVIVGGSAGFMALGCLIDDLLVRRNTEEVPPPSRLEYRNSEWRAQWTRKWLAMRASE